MPGRPPRARKVAKTFTTTFRRCGRRGPWNGTSIRWHATLLPVREHAADGSRSEGLDGTSRFHEGWNSAGEIAPRSRDFRRGAGRLVPLGDVCEGAHPHRSPHEPRQEA